MPDPEFETLRLIRDGAVLTIELHRPDALNALTIGCADEIAQAVAVAEDPSVRAVVLTGAGRAFSSGADLKAPTDKTLPSGRPDFEHSLTHHFNEPVRALRALPKPVVAAVNGPAVGVAVSYALACDLVVASRSAYFLLSFVNIGLVPDGGASALITARVGTGRFAELSMLGQRLDAETALAWGLIDRLEEPDALAGAAQALAAELAAGAIGAMGAVKQMVNDGPLRGLDDALALEARLQGTRGDDPEFAEGVASFLEKRAPQFTRA